MDYEQRKKALIALQGVFKNVIIAAMNVTKNIIYTPSERDFVLNTNERVLNTGIKFRQFLETNTTPLNELLKECINIQKSIEEYLKQTTLSEQTRGVCLLLHASVEVLIGILTIPTQINQPIS